MALKFNISAVYGPIELCFGYDAAVSLCCHISGAYGPIIGFRAPLEPLYDPVTPKNDSILDLAIILDIFALSRLYFEYDVAVGLFYQPPRLKPLK